MIQPDGYTIIPSVLTEKQIAQLKAEIQQFVKGDSAYGIRQIHRKIPAISQLARSPSIIKHLNYSDRKPRLVKAIYFNKTLQNNWFVGWHQDKTICVREKIKTPGFVNWTVKQGVVHVQPPLYIMQKIITLRLHLDITNSDNGALQVIPRSHHRILNSHEIEIKTASAPQICKVQAGDALIMSPLILHSSSKSLTPNNRAIIHLEYSTARLPNNLQWI